MSEQQMMEAFEARDAARVRELVSQDAGLARSRKDGVSLLLAARYRGDRAMTEALRAAGQPLDVFEAAAFDDADRLAVLLDQDPTLATSWSDDGFTPLHLSAFFGGDAGARLLVEAGADLNVVSRNDFTVAPLHSAAAGREDVGLLLVDSGADVNVRQRHGWTPLHSAANNGYLRLLEALLAAGADPAAANDDGVTALDMARKAGHDRIVERLEGMVAAAQ